MAKLVIILALLLNACGPMMYGVSIQDDIEDPKVLALRLAEVLNEWDTIVGVRHKYPIYLVGNGEIPAWTPRELGECQRVWNRVTVRVNLDGIRRTPDPDRVFRHVLFHELYHAEASCSDSDHSSDPENLMYPTTLMSNLDALPDAAQRMAIGAP